MLHDLCPGIFSYQDMCYCQTAQGMKRSNMYHLLVTCTVGVEDSHLERDGCSLRSADLTSCQEVGQGP